MLTKYITKADNPFYVKMPLSKCQFSSSILLPVMWYSWYIFGLGLLYSSVEYMKLFTGELRPYFIPVCNPNFSLVNCTQGSQRYPVYVTDYECRGDPKEVVESRYITYSMVMNGIIVLYTCACNPMYVWNQLVTVNCVLELLLFRYCFVFV